MNAILQPVRCSQGFPSPCWLQVIGDDSLMSFRSSKNVSASADFGAAGSPAMAASMRRSMAMQRTGRESTGGKDASPFGETAPS